MHEFKDKERVQQMMDAAIRALAEQAGEEIGIAIIVIPGNSPVNRSTGLLVCANSGEDRDIVVELLEHAAERTRERLAQIRSMN